MMLRRLAGPLLLLVVIAFVVVVFSVSPWASTTRAPADRQEVVFWHFWGGADRDTVDDIVKRFNASQDNYFVRAIAMPGSNLDLKLFLALAGGQPPDIVNQDDPIIADWASRGAIAPLSELAHEDELKALRHWLYPAARQLGEFEGALYGLCNGLDVRALYYNATLLAEHELQPPRTIAELDRIATQIAPPADRDTLTTFGFLPNPRNLWCWGIVFGGNFYDGETRQLTLADPEIARALDWMAGYGRRYGTAAVTFRAKDQSLPGKTFPLLANRYATVVDGQWRIRDIEAHVAAQRAAGKPITKFGVCPLPSPAGGQQDAGWINGNFFVVPAGARRKRGAWEFMKFWSGFGGHQRDAAATCVRGGWIPVSAAVAQQELFQAHIDRQPLWQCFIRLASSGTQQPRPNVRGAAMLDREVRQVAETAMYGSQDATSIELLRAAAQRIERASER